METNDQEILAMASITTTLNTLDDKTRIRVIQWLAAKYLQNTSSTHTEPTPSPVALIEPKVDAKSTSSNSSKKARRSSGNKAASSQSFVKDLDLSNRSRDVSLKDFYDQKQPANDMERNAIFVYYLERMAGITGITLDHIYTCYKEVAVKVPVLYQSFKNTAHRKGWIDTENYADLKVTVGGENFVELTLPHKAAS